MNTWIKNICIAVLFSFIGYTVAKISPTEQVGKPCQEILISTVENGGGSGGEAGSDDIATDGTLIGGTTGTGRTTNINTVMAGATATGGITSTNTTDVSFSDNEVADISLMCL
jgi:hypothetical protein